ncbi:hypothetical protein KBD34_02170 [Patescibacteria group bacterium]|nr:hypothetical protein [Patescibacteria group bacterium]
MRHMSSRHEMGTGFSESKAKTYLEEYWKKHRIPFDEEDVQEVVSKMKDSNRPHSFVLFSAIARKSKFEASTRESEIVLSAPEDRRAFYETVIRDEFKRVKYQVTDDQVNHLLGKLMAGKAERPKSYALTAVRNYLKDVLKHEVALARKGERAKEKVLAEADVERQKMEAKRLQDEMHEEFVRVSVRMLGEIRESQIRQLDMVRIRFFEKEEDRPELMKKYLGTITNAARDQYVTRGLRLLEGRASTALIDWLHQQKNRNKMKGQD